VPDLRQVGGEKRRLDHEEERRRADDEPGRAAPETTDDDEEENGGREGGCGDRSPVGKRDPVRALEREDECEHRGHQQPVDRRHIDLAVIALRGMGDLQPREVTELGRLVCQREGAGDHGLRRDHGCRRGEDYQGIAAPCGASSKKGAPIAPRSSRISAACPEVAEEAGRKDEQQPGAGYGRPSEVAHVGVERLDAGERQDDGGQREEPGRPAVERKSNA
jgi:hypothetical protein